MSVRNVLKNLGTVVEYAENGDDASSSIKKRKHAQEIAQLAGQSENIAKTNRYANTSPREDESSPYQSAYSSIDDFINAESEEPNISYKCDNPEVKCDYPRTPTSRQQIQSEDNLSGYEESENENGIVELPPVSSASAATRTPSHQSSASTRGAHPKSFLIGRPFNHSRLNLLTFLNNIATPSIRTDAQRAARQSKNSKKQSILSFTTTKLDEKQERKTSASCGTKKEEAETRPNISSAVIKSDKKRNDEELKPSLTAIIGSSTHDTTNHFTLFTPKQISAGSSETKLVGSPRPDTVVAESLLTSMNSGDSRHTDEMASSTRTMRSGKSCDKISTTSDMTVASVFSASSLSNGSTTNSSGKRKSRECIVCCMRQSSNHFTHLISCGHRSCCRSCMIKYLNVEIMENRTELSCPQCSASLHVNDIYALLIRLPRLLERYESFSLRRVLSADPDTRWCPAPDCTYAVIATACAACPQLSCGRPGCGTMFCYHCKNYWHANQTCDQARESEFADFGGSLAKAFDAMAAAGRDEPSTSAKTSKGSNQSFDAVKSCPRCGALIVKMNDGSCNHMTCALCGVEFCWLCLKQINELHYISPTGCTFWGKKPWTRKKKLLWQIGTLIGAPLGIALIAGLAVPGIICGVPIFVGRRTYQRFHFLSRTKRHLITAVSVTGSLLVSPVLAVMAVGVGVPIMLAYVYGVVPLSLCRNGGCGSGADAQELPYANEEAENASLLNSDVQERSQLLRALRESVSRTNASAPAPTRKPKKLSLEITVSDRSSASSPSGTFFTAGLRGVDRQNATTKSLVSPSRASEAMLLRERIGGEASVGSVSTLQGQSIEASAGCSISRMISTNSQRQAYRGTHLRQHSNESGVMSFCDKSEDASTKAIAGSHCNYDVRSVNTLWSSGGCGANVCVANNDDNASMKACGGSVLGARSLAESGTSSTLPHLACLSRENDVSPAEVLLDAGDFALKKFSSHSDEDDKGGEAQNSQRLASVSDDNASMKACGGSVLEACSLAESGTSLPHLPFSSRLKVVSDAAAVAEELVRSKFGPKKNEKDNNLMNHSLSTLPSYTSQCQCLQFIVFDESDNCNSLDAQLSNGVGKCAHCTELEEKKASVAMISSTSQRSFRSGVARSSIASTELSMSNISGAQSVALKMMITAESAKKDKRLSTERQESSRMSLRKLIRRPIDLLTGRFSNNANHTESQKKSSTAPIVTTSRKAAITEIRYGSTNTSSKSVKIYTK